MFSAREVLEFKWLLLTLEKYFPYFYKEPASIYLQTTFKPFLCTVPPLTIQNLLRRDLLWKTTYQPDFYLGKRRSLGFFSFSGFEGLNFLFLDPFPEYALSSQKKCHNTSRTGGITQVKFQLTGQNKSGRGPDSCCIQWPEHQPLPPPLIEKTCSKSGQPPVSISSCEELVPPFSLEVSRYHMS